MQKIKKGENIGLRATMETILQAINWAPIIDIEYDMCDYILDYVFIM